MVETSVKYLQFDQNDNTFLGGQSIPAAILNNNMMPIDRLFGREISNYRSTSDLSKPMNKQEEQAFSNHYNNTSLLHAFENELDGIPNISMLELPKRNRDPFLASRQLLSSTQNTDKFKMVSKIESRSQCSQKASANLVKMENCDLIELKNPQYVSAYAKEIYDHLLEVEGTFHVKYGYLAKIQTDINQKMRGVLIDWLVELHIKFKLLPETLYLAVNLIDRFLEKVNIPKHKLQLVGITAMIIASKYQEIYPPEIKDFTYVTDKAYSKQEVLDMEGQMLCCLKFKLTIPSMLTFLDRFSKLATLDKKSFFFCQYIIETALLDYNMLKYRPSLIVWGAIELANKVLKNPSYNELLSRNLQQDESDLRPCYKDLANLMQNVRKSDLKAVYKKFLSDKFLEVAKLQINVL